MRYTTRFFDAADPFLEEVWSQLWAGSPQASPFSTLGYVRALAALEGWRGEVAVTLEEDIPVAAWPLYLRKKGPFRLASIPPFTPFTTPLLARLPEPVAVHERTSVLDVLADAVGTRYDHLLQHLDPSLADVRPFQWRGWAASPRYTYLLALDPGVNPATGFSSATRRTLKTNAPDFRIAEQPEAGPAIAALCEASYTRQQQPMALPAQAVAGLIERLASAGMIRCFTATRPDAPTPEAGIAVLHAGTTASYWVAGSSPGPAMTVLLGSLLPRLAQDGFRNFDFIGANTPSIAEFKRRFNPTLCPYFRVEKTPSPILRLVKALGRP